MKVAIAMSGGVDSSVVAALLKKQGHDCFGVHLDVGNEGTEANVKDAQTVCDKIGIKLHVINLKKEFKKMVIDYYINAYKQGETPNPCVMCNPRIKFGELLKRVRKLGADHIATGHYARIKERKGAYELHKGIDVKKDQSYFLYRLTQDKLKQILFPLGDLKKTKTRKIAKELGLKIVEEKKESQGVCFIPEKFYTDFLKKHLDESYFKEGLILDTDGNKCGRHRGLPYYTCGQRKGIRVGGLAEAHYVVKTDHKKNELIIGTDDQLWYKEITAYDLSFISEKVPNKPFKCQARIRHLGALQPAQVSIEDGIAQVKFPKPVRAFTEGQSIVFYQRSKVLGGGIMRFVNSTHQSK